MKPLSNFSFRVGTWDTTIFDIVNTHNEYRLPDSFLPTDTIIDIGAHIGSFGYACLTRGAGKILAYEAFEENYKLTKDNLEQFGEKSQVNHAAVWRSDKHVENLSFTASHEAQNTGGGNVWSEGGTITVPVISLDLILMCRLKRIRLLKLDCEGSEFPILFTSRYLDKIDAICGEYHEIGGKFNPIPIPEHVKVDGYNEYTIEVLKEFLNKQGFTVEYTRSKDSTGKETNLGLFFATR